MATAGNFPKVTGDTIYLADYNAIQSVIAGVVSTYYSNPISSAPITGTPTITAALMDNLRLDINKAYTHITGSNSTIADIAATNLISKDDFNAYKVAADYCETNKNTVYAPTQLSASVLTQSLTATWQGVKTWTYTLTWSNPGLADKWFNCGGYILVDVSGSNSSGSSKDNDWQNNILNAIPSQTYGNVQWDAGTNIDVYEYGNVTQYAENYCRIVITKVSTTQISVSVILNDADAGDQTGIGPAVDEDVNTDAAASITYYNSIDAITVTAPSTSQTSGW